MLSKLLFIIILILAFLLRIYELDKIPPSLSWDEVSIGFNAYSILKTGQDEWGYKLPFSFRAYGDYKLPGYIYLDVPFIAVFGLNELGVRLPSVLLGLGLVVLIFLILKELINVKAALWGAFIMAILPWSIILSRIALEAHAALFLTTLAVYTFLLGIKRSHFLIISSVSFGLSLFCYNSSRVVTPLLIILLTAFFSKELKKELRVAVISGLIFLVFLVVVLPHAFLQDSSARYRWTAILDEGAINRINELRGSSALPPALTLLVYNKVTYFVPEVTKNYLSHFNPNFLFLNGGSHYQFSVPGSGLIYPILAPFLIGGLLVFVRTRKRWQLFTAAWLLISFIPAAVTRDAPHALRTLMVIPALIIIIACGIDSCFNDLNQWIKQKKVIFSALLVGVLLISLLMFWQNYSDGYTKNYSWSWQYGYKQVVDFINTDGSKYDKIFVTKKYGEPHEFFLFYLQSDPNKYLSDPNLSRYNRSDWYWVDSFDKFLFINDWEIKTSAKCETQNMGCLLIASPGNYSNRWVKVKTVSFLDGQPAFEILESKDDSK